MLKARIERLAFVIGFLILISFVTVCYSMEPVVVEFLYYEPCTCDAENYEIYEHNSQVMEDLQGIYGSKILIEKIYFYSEEGQSKTSEYGIGIADWNAIIINYERVVLDSVNETHIKEIIDAYLTDSVHDMSIISVVPSNSTVVIGGRVNITVTAKNLGIESESFEINTYCNESLIGTEQVADLSPHHTFSTIFVWDTSNYTSGNYVIKAVSEPVANETNLANNSYVHSNVEVRSSSSEGMIALFMLAFSFGFFETFSPCLLILLSFVLSHTIGKTSNFKESFMRSMTFGIGFISATMLLAIALGLLFLSTPALHHSLTLIVCVFAMVLGLNLLGVSKILPKSPFQSKPIIKKLARRYVITYAGLFLLGFIFYFLDPCIAPIFISMIPLLVPETLFFTLLVFCMGALIPFIAIGVFAGSISKLARSAYKQRSKIRAISGLILIVYAIYVIVSYLVPAIT